MKAVIKVIKNTILIDLLKFKISTGHCGSYPLTTTQFLLNEI